jgi:hypothetical protein
MVFPYRFWLFLGSKHLAFSTLQQIAFRFSRIFNFMIFSSGNLKIKNCSKKWNLWTLNFQHFRVILKPFQQKWKSRKSCETVSNCWRYFSYLTVPSFRLIFVTSTFYNYFLYFFCSFVILFQLVFLSFKDFTWCKSL